MEFLVYIYQLKTVKMIIFWNDWKSLIRFCECPQWGLQLVYEIWLVYKALYSIFLYSDGKSIYWKLQRYWYVFWYLKNNDNFYWYAWFIWLCGICIAIFFDVTGQEIRHVRSCSQNPQKFWTLGKKHFQSYNETYNCMTPL